jgi:hypothetical protein
MTTVPVPRWAVSFADLFLLLLGCFVLLHAMEAARPRAGADANVARAAGGYRAADLFQPGEAVLRPEARALLQGEGRRLAGREENRGLSTIKRTWHGSCFVRLESLERPSWCQISDVPVYCACCCARPRPLRRRASRIW